MKRLIKGKMGFTLIEMIITIAVMAALIGVGAATIIPYLEKTRVSHDQVRISKMHSTAVDYIDSRGIKNVLDKFWDAYSDASGNLTTDGMKSWQKLIGYSNGSGAEESPYGGIRIMSQYDYGGATGNRIGKSGSTKSPSLWLVDQPLYVIANSIGLDATQMLDDNGSKPPATSLKSPFESWAFTRTNPDNGDQVNIISLKIDLMKNNPWTTDVSKNYSGVAGYGGSKPTRDVLDYNNINVVLYTYQYKWKKEWVADSKMDSIQGRMDKYFYYDNDGHSEMNAYE
ncbi:MAG: prepilin-type N-terminal cleavage/methylation domain-containing protein [Lachnospiraceae bacterium]|nr:prepilin-type N-terminal cleavage/methylation domain-containing protein [Lachnospiraceae bacterium]